MSATTETDNASAGGDRVARQLIGFVRLLRDNDLPLGLRESADCLRAARQVGLDDMQSLRLAFRALLCTSQADWKRFDQLFDLYWRGHGTKVETRIAQGGGRAASRDGAEARGPRIASNAILGSERGDGLETESSEGRRGGASQAETLARTDLRHINDPDELDRVYVLSERLARQMRYRLSRRERQRRRGRRLDLRKVIHRSVPYGGTPMKLAFRARRDKPLRLVVLLDASGSMSLYSAFFMRFLRGVLDHFREAEAFVFHTRLVHISTALREKDVEKALERTALMATGWGGGTRIGDSLAAFNRHHAKSVLNSRSVVMVVSDGYDTGSPERLGREMAQLKRRARRIVWLNPMIGWRDYAPEAGGMKAALPYVDLFAPAHNLESLAALEPYLASL